MKPEEAIEVLENYTINLIEYAEVSEDSIPVQTYRAAVQALEKQVPKKPDNLCGYSCRACSGRLARQTDLVNQKYCHHCGQKINWEETP